MNTLLGNAIFVGLIFYIVNRTVTEPFCDWLKLEIKYFLERRDVKSFYSNAVLKWITIEGLFSIGKTRDRKIFRILNLENTCNITYKGSTEQSTYLILS
jgi:hypothetical protein